MPVDLIEISKLIAQLGGLVVLAGAVLLGIVVPKSGVQAIEKERDKADALRDLRLEDQKMLNKELTEVLKANSAALSRMADAFEARNEADRDRRRIGDGT